MACLQARTGGRKVGWIPLGVATPQMASAKTLPRPNPEVVHLTFSHACFDWRYTQPSYKLASSGGVLNIFTRLFDLMCLLVHGSLGDI